MIINYIDVLKDVVEGKRSYSDKSNMKLVEWYENDKRKSEIETLSTIQI